MIVMRSRTGDDVRSLEPTIIRLIDSSTAQDLYNAQSILIQPALARISQNDILFLLF